MTAALSPTGVLVDRRVIPHGDWKTIVADPPWQIDLNRKTPHPAKGSAFGSHVRQLTYPTMSDHEIEALCPPAADAAHLYLWTCLLYTSRCV